MGRPKPQCLLRVAGDQRIQELGVFIVKRGDMQVPGAKECHQEADLCGNRLKKPAEPWRVGSPHNRRMKAHVSLCRGFPVLVIADLRKPCQRFPDWSHVGTVTDRADRLKFDESTYQKYVVDVLTGETAYPGSS